MAPLRSSSAGGQKQEKGISNPPNAQNQKDGRKKQATRYQKPN
jgi:hypothetical protein